MLKNYKNRKFAITLIEIFIFDVKIEYIDSIQLIFVENYFFVSNALEIFTKNFHKQIKTYCIIRINNISKKFFILFLLNFVSKTNNNWKRIHNLFYFKHKFIFVNFYIFEKRDILKYIIFDKTIDILICIKKNSKLIKQNLINTFKHISIIKSNW